MYVCAHSNVLTFLFIHRLWGNKIGDAGAQALADALQNSETLLWLRYNLLPFKVVDVFRRLFIANSCVFYVHDTISLVGNGVGSTGACALANIIRHSSSLEEIW